MPTASRTLHREHTRERVPERYGQQRTPDQLQGFRPAIDEECECVACSPMRRNSYHDATAAGHLRARPRLRTIRASVGDGVESNGSSSFPSVSADCQLIAFQSNATNLVDDDANLVSDIFVFNRGTGLTTRVSNGDSGEANGAAITPAISADGRCVAFRIGGDQPPAGHSNGTTDVYVACDGEITSGRASPTGAEADGIASFRPQRDAPSSRSSRPLQPRPYAATGSPVFCP